MAIGRLSALINGNHKEDSPSTPLRSLQASNAKVIISSKLTLPESKKSPNPQKDTDPILQLKEVSYCIPKVSEPIIDKVSLTIYPKQLIGLAGESGSGKSSLLRLIARLIPTQDNTTFLNGTPYEKIKEDNFRHHVTYIPQQHALFPVDLPNNLFVPPCADTHTLKKAIRKAQMEHKLSELMTVKNLKTFGLSGGEIQRIALARAFINPSSLLLLDEPSSSLDTQNSKAVAQILEELATNKAQSAIIVASHDEDILKVCETIILIDKGSLVAQGSHADLKEKIPLYQRIIAGL